MNKLHNEESSIRNKLIENSDDEDGQGSALVAIKIEEEEEFDLQELGTQDIPPISAEIAQNFNSTSDKPWNSNTTSQNIHTEKSEPVEKEKDVDTKVSKANISDKTEDERISEPINQKPEESLSNQPQNTQLLEKIFPNLQANLPTQQLLLNYIQNVNMQGTSQSSQTLNPNMMLFLQQMINMHPGLKNPENLLNPRLLQQLLQQFAIFDPSSNNQFPQPVNSLLSPTYFQNQSTSYPSQYTVQDSTKIQQFPFNNFQSQQYQQQFIPNQQYQAFQPSQTQYQDVKNPNYDPVKEEEKKETPVTGQQESNFYENDFKREHYQSNYQYQNYPKDNKGQSHHYNKNDSQQEQQHQPPRSHKYRSRNAPVQYIPKQEPQYEDYRNPGNNVKNYQYADQNRFQNQNRSSYHYNRMNQQQNIYQKKEFGDSMGNQGKSYSQNRNLGGKKAFDLVLDDSTSLIKEGSYIPPTLDELIQLIEKAPSICSRGLDCSEKHCRFPHPNLLCAKPLQCLSRPRPCRYRAHLYSIIKALVKTGRVELESLLRKQGEKQICALELLDYQVVLSKLALEQKERKNKVAELKKSQYDSQGVESSEARLQEELSALKTRIQQTDMIRRIFLKCISHTLLWRLSDFQDCYQEIIHEIMIEKNCATNLLPIYSVKNDIFHFLSVKNVHQNYLVLVGETGCGKSTQLPIYIYQYLRYRPKLGQAIIVQPRKIAALSLTRRVADELHSDLGKYVGYCVGEKEGEEKSSEETKIIFMTDVQFMKTLIQNPELKGYSFVVVDEAHERSINCDMMLAFFKKKFRPQLKVIVTSASIEVEKFANYLETPREVRVVGRQYPITISYLPINAENSHYLPEVKTLVLKLLRLKYQALNDPERFYKNNPDVEKDMSIFTGHMLVFLPSVEDIETLKIQLKEEATKDKERPTRTMPLFFVMKFHGKMRINQFEEIFKDISPLKFTKVILATRVAETSLTFPELSIVIDLGYENESFYNSELGTYETRLLPISKSCAKQRAGRAGRTRPGICYRLYSQETYEGFSESKTPEIVKLNLEHPLLTATLLGINLRKDRFLDRIPSNNINDAESNLRDYRALRKETGLSEIGLKMQQCPIEPYLSRTLFEALALGVFDEVAMIVSMLKFATNLYNFNQLKSSEKLAVKLQLWENFSDLREYEGADGDHFLYLFIFKRFLREFVPTKKTTITEIPLEKDTKISKGQTPTTQMSEQQADPAMQWCIKHHLNYNTLRRVNELYNELKTIFTEDQVLEKQTKDDKSRVDNILKSLFQTHMKNICLWASDPRLGYLLIGKNNKVENVYVHEQSIYYGREGETSWIFFSQIQDNNALIAQSITAINEQSMKSWATLTIAEKRLKEIKNLLEGQSFKVLKANKCGTATIAHLDQKMKQLKNFRLNNGIVYKADFGRGSITVWYPTACEDAKDAIISVIVRSKGFHDNELHEIKVRDNTKIVISQGCNLREVLIDDETITLCANEIDNDIQEADIQAEIERICGKTDVAQIKLIADTKDDDAKYSVQVVCQSKEIAKTLLESTIKTKRHFRLKPQDAASSTKSQQFTCKVIWFSGLPSGEATITFSDPETAKKAADRLKGKLIKDCWLTQESCDIHLGQLPENIDEIKLANLLNSAAPGLEYKKLIVWRQDYEFDENLDFERSMVLSLIEETRKRMYGFRNMTVSNKLQKFKCQISFHTLTALERFIKVIDLKEIPVETPEGYTVITLHAKPRLYMGEVRLHKERYRVFEKQYQDLVKRINAQNKNLLRVELPEKDWSEKKGVNFIKIKIMPNIAHKSLMQVAQQSLDIKKGLKNESKGRVLEKVMSHKLAALVYTKAFAKQLDSLSKKYNVFLSPKASNKIITAYGVKSNVEDCETALLALLNERLEDMEIETFAPKECDLSSFFTRGISTLQRACPGVLINTRIIKGNFIFELIGPREEIEKAEETIENELVESDPPENGITCCVCNTPSIVNPYYMHCGHGYCFNCAKQYLLALCKRREFDWHCFEEKCTAKIIVRDIMSILPGDDLVDYLRNGLLKKFFEEKECKLVECMCGLTASKYKVGLAGNKCVHLE